VGEVPFNLRVTKTIGAIVAVGFDRDGADASAQVDRHKDVAGFVVRGDFHG
jgi:hypothetical protein